MNCHTVESLEQLEEQNTADLLHIPTPWHNTVCQIKGDSTLYVVKSAVAQKALKSEKYRGGWIAATKDHGGYYSLQKVDMLNAIAPITIKRSTSDHIIFREHVSYNEQRAITSTREFEWDEKRLIRSPAVEAREVDANCQPDWPLTKSLVDAGKAWLKTQKQGSMTFEDARE